MTYIDPARGGKGCRGTYTADNPIPRAVAFRKIRVPGQNGTHVGIYRVHEMLIPMFWFIRMRGGGTYSPMVPFSIFLPVSQQPCSWRSNQVPFYGAKLKTAQNLFSRTISKTSSECCAVGDLILFNSPHPSGRQMVNDA